MKGRQACGLPRSFAMKVIDMHTHLFPEKIAAKATIATAE